jgi:hypothetical protein
MKILRDPIDMTDLTQQGSIDHIFCYYIGRLRIWYETYAMILFFNFL